MALKMQKNAAIMQKICSQNAKITFCSLKRPGSYLIHVQGVYYIHIPKFLARLPCFSHSSVEERPTMDQRVPGSNPGRALPKI